MRVLIVGGAGFLGTNLAHLCFSRRDDVVVLDSLEPRLRSTTDGLATIRDRIKFVQADVRDSAELVRDCDVIVNCAGQTSHPVSMKDPAFDIELNCASNIALLEAVRMHNPGAVIVYTSTSTVVGKATAGVAAIDETHLEAPLDIYSANKLAAEKYYRIYHTAHGLKTIILRFPNLYGPYGKPFPELGFINYFISLAAGGGEIQLYGTGEQLRNAVYAGDACEVIVAAAERLTAYGTPLFAAHDEHISVAEIALQIVATFGGSVRHVEWPADRKKIEVDNQVISGARLHSLLGWKAKRSFRDGLAETLERMKR
ncbi:MAG TPA: NAD-dependent epimerase/dehydratase family protein [Kofleriaceae bacterium]|nr:NAD-dependent epimerase/dehydratase family protein [Kofleriaceae bacterium]